MTISQSAEDAAIREGGCTCANCITARVNKYQRVIDSALAKARGSDKAEIERLVSATTAIAVADEIKLKEKDAEIARLTREKDQIDTELCKAQDESDRLRGVNARILEKPDPSSAANQEPVVPPYGSSGCNCYGSSGIFNPNRCPIHREAKPTSQEPVKARELWVEINEDGRAMCAYDSREEAEVSKIACSIIVHVREVKEENRC